MGRTTSRISSCSASRAASARGRAIGGPAGRRDIIASSATRHCAALDGVSLRSTSSAPSVSIAESAPGSEGRAPRSRRSRTAYGSARPSRSSSVHSRSARSRTLQSLGAKHSTPLPRVTKHAPHRRASRVPSSHTSSQPDLLPPRGGHCDCVSRPMSSGCRQRTSQ